MRRRPFSNRFGLASALVVPCCAGLVFTVLAGAPVRYTAVNSVALVLALGWIGFGRVGLRLAPRRCIAAGLVALLAVPLATGPEIDGVARWVPIGPLTLHAGMIAVPLLAVLTARDRAWGPAFLSGALVFCGLQPDAATALAVTGAAAVLAFALRSLGFAAVALVGAGVTYLAFGRGYLPPQPFVEDVLAQAWRMQPAAAIALTATLIYPLVILACQPAWDRSPALALAGTLAGFVTLSLLGSYPTPLVGYGAAPILGFGIALGLLAGLPREPMRSGIDEKTA